MGMLLSPLEITEGSFRSGILEVLGNRQFRHNAQKVKSIMSDSPVKSKELFLYWINYAIRHNGAKHLVSDAVLQMNSIQYWSIDVIAFLLGVPIILIIVLVRVTKFLCRGQHQITHDSKKRR